MTERNPESRSIVEQLLEDDGVESWVRQGRIPFIFKVTDGDVRYIAFIPPEDTGFDTKVVPLEGVGVYFQKKDGSYITGDAILLSEEEANEIGERIKGEVEVQGLAKRSVEKRKKRFGIF